MEIEQKHFDAMMNGTKCSFWDDDPHVCNAVDYLEGIKTKEGFHFLARDSQYYYTNCEPLKTVTYVKSCMDIMKWLMDYGYKPNNRGGVFRR